MATITDENIKEIYNTILNSKFKRFIYPYSWMSGSSTVIEPLMAWKHDIEIQLDPSCSHRGRYAAFRAVLLHLQKRFPQLTGGFYRGDGSYPSTYTIFLNNYE